MSTKLDKDQVIKASFDETNQQFNVLVIVGTVDNTPSHLDAEQIWKKVFDETTQSLRIIRVN